MSLTNIQNLWEAEKFKLQLKIDQMCIYRTRLIVSSIKHFRITKVLFGNGGWSVEGDDFPITYDDESQGSAPIVRIMCYHRYQDFMWTPDGLTLVESELIKEFIELCDWWCDITGGEDVTFHA